MLGISRATLKQPPGTHAVVHHMVFSRDTLEDLFQAVHIRVQAPLDDTPAGLVRPGPAWEPWMTFVELFNGHHTARSTLYTRDPPPAANLTLLQLHESSEYELYDTFAFHSAKRVARRQLRFADVGQCCFTAGGEQIPGCNIHALHDELAEVYGLDYIACHGPFRSLAQTGSAKDAVDY